MLLCLRSPCYRLQVQFFPWRRLNSFLLLVSALLRLVRFQSKPFNITGIQVYAPTSNAEEAEVEWFCEDLQDLLELTPKKDVLFIIGDWNAKVGSQEIPGVIGKFGLRVQNNEGQRLTVLPRGCTGHSKHPFPTTQEKTLQMDITRWSKLKSDWLYSLQPKMEKFYTVN